MCLLFLAEFPEGCLQMFTLLEARCVQDLPCLCGTAQESGQHPAGEVSAVGLSLLGLLSNMH